MPWLIVAGDDLVWLWINTVIILLCKKSPQKANKNPFLTGFPNKLPVIPVATFGDAF
jgi:hypothetical protein